VTRKVSQCPRSISEIEEQGIKEMKEDKGNAFVCTDKSGRNLYTEAMQPHLTDDAKTTWQEQCNTEKNMTGHTLQWGRLLRLGSKWDNGGRHRAERAE